ncbi:MAG: type VI secretion system membrane subunit TssM [Blastocatellia bacterium]|nr:type VI secretion system membrane subunit TssM [Blastocatellia bacterium]
MFSTAEKLSFCPARSISAGLDFHTLPSQRQSDQNLIRPTRDCRWQVTDRAVLLDTAGRYQVEGPDRDEWSALIETMKKYRKARPLDGMLIVASAARVHGSGEAEIEQQAKVLRARLDEVIERTRIRFPVYLVFSHLDCVEGFDDFFRPFGREERAQVWGATIPLEKSQNAHALFDVEFDCLQDTLMRRRLSRMGEPAPPREQLNIFDMPLHFGDMRRKLGLFTSALFRPNPFSESPLLRGFYFTSSAANGGPRQPASTVSGTSTSTMSNPVSEVKVAGGGYFTESLFKDVLLGDRNLAASFQAGKKNPYRLRNALLTAAALLLFLVAGGMVVSFLNNRLLISNARNLGSRVDEITRTNANKDSGKKDQERNLYAAAARVEIEAVEELRSVLADLDDYDRNRPPLYLRFGLYSGDEINPYLRTIYFESITRHFFKPAVATLEQDLQSLATASPDLNRPVSDTGPPDNLAQQDDLGRYYDLLKAYLMLSNREKVQPAFLVNQLADYWRRSGPPDMEMVSDEQLKFYAAQAFAEDAPGYKPDDKLVADARRRLEAYPPVNRFFKQITSDIDAEAPPVTLEAILHTGGRGVFSASYSVPGSFTREGYRKHWGEALRAAAEEIAKDDWVMGSQSAAARDESADISKLQSMYFREYTAQWQRFVKSINVRPFRTKDDAVEALKVLSASDSPMELVMIEVERNTNLSAEESGGGFFGWLGGLFSSKTESVGGATEVEREFKPLSVFVLSEDERESAPASQYRATLRRVLDALEGKSDDQLAQTATAILTGKDELGLNRAEQEVSRLLDSFKTAASSDVARLLKQPLSNLRAMFYGGGYELIEKSWREQIYPEAQALESGFPFASSSSQTPVTDLARFLNPVNGRLTLFFNDKLATSFEDAQGQWRLKESGAVKLSDGFVNYLNSARRVRDALFPAGGQQPEAGYEITLQPLSGTDVVIEVDGNRVETRGTSPQSAKFLWPARAGSSGARISVVGGIGQSAEKTFPGEWGLFQMFAAGKPTKIAENQYQLSWTVDSATVRAVLRPSSATNPFDRSLFTQMRAPQTLN